VKVDNNWFILLYIRRNNVKAIVKIGRMSTSKLCLMHAEAVGEQKKPIFLCIDLSIDILKGFRIVYKSAKTLEGPRKF
jgi:hypothetical protein